MSATHNMPDGREESTEEMVFSALANARRRAVVRFLETHAGESTLAELTTHLSEQEGRDPDNRAETKAVYVSLLQSHIPHLENAGVVTFNADRGLVRLTDRAELVLPYLHLDEDRPSTLLSRLFA